MPKSKKTNSQQNQAGDDQATSASPSRQGLSRRGLSRRRKIVFGLFTVIVFFAIAEGMLRFAGFRVEQRVEHMQFSFPIDDYNNNSPQPFLQRDPVLFWKPTAGILGHNSLGCYGPEFSKEKPAEKTRVLCLGDSCTHFGPISYPDILRATLEKTAPGEYEVINAGVIGYTSYQGKTLLESVASDWSPDIVTVYFGWNDHWLSVGVEDKNQHGGQASPVTDTLGGLRLFQVARMLKSNQRDASSKQFRVSLTDYEKNLRSISDWCRSNNAQPCYLTAPHAFDLGIPPYLVQSGEITDEASLIPLHQSYNEVVRKVAKESSVPLIDLAVEMQTMDKQKLFIEDHIHLSESGRVHVARRIKEVLENIQR
ncbi:SGNH/GDSL hydrolase family protein [Stieleria marina]|uniref:SGNH/GDSL hydrolase family protein n=1 Tax=Stieleria marina TaxID=1930275 RepID=UPI003AF342A0